jgi:hypothetical protein
MEEARLFGTALPSSGSADCQGVPEEQSGPLPEEGRAVPKGVWLTARCSLPSALRLGHKTHAVAVLQCCSAAVAPWPRSS